jgi:hypothetical protein
VQWRFATTPIAQIVTTDGGKRLKTFVSIARLEHIENIRNPHIWGWRDNKLLNMWCYPHKFAAGEALWE